MFRIISVLILLPCIAASAVLAKAETRVYKNQAHAINPSAAILVLPIDTVYFSAFDNTRAAPEILYPDSMLRSDLRVILAAEARRWLGANILAFKADSLPPRPRGGYSVLAGDSTDTLGLRAWISRIAACNFAIGRQM